MTGQGPSQPNALAPAPRAQSGTPRDLPPLSRAGPGAGGPQSLHPQDEPGTLGAYAAAPTAAVPDALSTDPLPPEIVVQGRRPTPLPRVTPIPGGDGWDKVVRADSTAAMKAEREIFGARKEHLDDWQHVTTTGMRLLAGVRDQAGYDRAKQSAQTLFDSYGVPFPELPDEYSPEAIRDIQMAQLDAEDQIKAALAQNKFEWQQTDDLLDNGRADRNVDSQIHDRDARRGLTVRGQDMTDARGRYGIGVASSDRRRGQDLTDKRTREIAATRPARSTAAAGKLTRIAVGKGGKKIGWNGKAWVPAQ